MPNCERCGRENPDEARFCNGCGAELVLAPAQTIEERKVVTALFADITGSTTLGQLERARALLTTLDPPTREVTPHEPLA